MDTLPPARPELLREAAAQAEAGRLAEALAMLGSADPATLPAAAALLAARALCDRPDPLAALAPLERVAADAATKRERRVLALRLLGRLHSGLGQTLLAADCYRRVLELRPADAEAQFLLGRACLDAGWPDLAAAAFAGVQELHGWWRGMAAEAPRRLAKARRLALTLLRRRHAGPLLEPEAVAELAGALISLGRLGAARRVAALTEDPALRAWLLARLAERAAWPDLPPLAPLPRTASLPAALREEMASWLLRRGAVAEARAALGPVAEETLRAPAFLLLARLMLLGGEVEELAALAGTRLARSPRRTPAARVVLTTHLLREPARLLRVEDLRAPPPGTPPLFGLPIVQYWDKPVPPPDVLAVMDGWVAQHPGARLLRFRRETARAYLAEGWGKRGVAAFDACAHPSVESDLLRYAVLAREGGIWTDADESCRRPWDGLLAVLPRGQVAAAFSDELPFYVHSYLLAAWPGTPLIQAALEAAMTALLRSRTGTPLNIWDGTGPGVLTRLVAARPDEARLLSMSLLRHLSGGAYDLSYKADAAADWRSGAAPVSAPGDASA